ncbi:thymidine kinase [Halomarina ordinaria]|uniref:Thymidine kinase n=1 Tax=Halomarina ordinaria TaxID=3033939 RepID=A0ABD5U9K2_9EURY|nr:thymidine kinase [Halomarina sp. PSRA2]
MHAITNSGWVEVITGCMFSGKTEELLRRLRRAEIAGQEAAVFTPAVDDRYGETTIGSHDGHSWAATVVDDGPDASDERPTTDGGVGAVRSTPDGRDGAWGILDHLNGEHVVAIDEANFFSTDLVAVCEHLASDGRRVIVSGTDQTFRGEPFDPLPQLVAVAEYVDKLQAICSVCGEPASRNQRLIDGEPAHADDPTILVGAEESYEARCRSCHVLRTD